MTFYNLTKFCFQTQMDVLRKDLKRIKDNVEFSYQAATRLHEMQRIPRLIQSYKDALEQNIELIQEKYTSSC